MYLQATCSLYSGALSSTVSQHSPSLLPTNIALTGRIAVLLEWYRSVTGMLEECYRTVTRVIQEC